MKAANPKAPPNGRRMFADAIISALHRAWDDGVALSVQVDDARGDSRAELRHRGAVLWSQAMPGAQLALPLGDAAPAAKATEAAAPQPAEKPVEKAAAPRRVESEGEPAATRCVVLSVEADDSHCDPVTVRAWAVAHGVHRVGPGVLYWHHEGGASEGNLRMVASLEREFVPLVVTALGSGAPLDVRGHDGPSSLLCVGRPVVDEATGLTWYVTEVQDGDGIVVAREGSTPRLTGGARVLPAHAFEHRWLAGDRVHQWTIVRASAPSKAPSRAKAANPRVIEGAPAELGDDLCATLHGGAGPAVAPELRATPPAAAGPEGLVLVVIDHGKAPPGIDCYENGAVVLWTFEGEEDTTIRTVVPAPMVPAIRKRVGVAYLFDQPATPQMPSHVVKVGEPVAVEGGMVEARGAAWTLLGVVEVDGGEGVPGLVLDPGEGREPAVAWADAAQVRDGRVVVFPGELYTARLEGGAWVAVNRQTKRTLGGPKKAPAKKAPKAKPPKDPAEARRAKAGYAADRGVVFVSRASDYGRVRCRELDPSKGGIGSVSGGSLGPWRLHGPVNPARTKLLAAIRSGLKKVTFFEVPDVDLAGAEAWLRDNGHLKPAKGAASPGAKAPARLAAVPDADGLAMHGETTIVAQAEEGGGWDRAWVERTEAGRRTKAQGWLGAAKLHRAREYNRGGKCVRDSADERGGAP